MKLHIAFKLIINYQYRTRILSEALNLYRVFHNVLLDYKHLKQENQRTYLNGIVHRRSEFVLTTRDFRCMHHWWYGTNPYDIQVLATHASTLVHRYSSLLQWSVPLGQRGHVAMVGRIPGLWHTPKENKITGRNVRGPRGAITSVVGHFQTHARCTVTTDLLVWYSNTQNDFSSGAAIFLTTYTCIAQRQKCELRWKTTYWAQKKNWVVPSVCTCFVNTCTTVFLE